MIYVSALVRVMSPDFELELPPASGVLALRTLIRRHPAVRDLRRQLDSGAISEEEIRLAIADALRQIVPGQRSELELGLAAIAVALERRPGALADEWIGALSHSRAVELQRASAIARLCRADRNQLAVNQTKRFRVGAAPDELLQWRPISAAGVEHGNVAAPSIVRERIEHPYGQA